MYANVCLYGSGGSVPSYQRARATSVQCRASVVRRWPGIAPALPAQFQWSTCWQQPFTCNGAQYCVSVAEARVITSQRGHILSPESYPAGSDRHRGSVLHGSQIHIRLYELRDDPVLFGSEGYYFVTLSYRGWYALTSVILPLFSVTKGILGITEILLCRRTVWYHWYNQRTWINFFYTTIDKDCIILHTSCQYIDYTATKECRPYNLQCSVIVVLRQVPLFYMILLSDLAF